MTTPLDAKLEEIAKVAWRKQAYDRDATHKDISDGLHVIMAALREAAEAGAALEREAMREYLLGAICGPRCGHSRHDGMRDVLAWLDARSDEQP